MSGGVARNLYGYLEVHKSRPARHLDLGRGGAARPAGLLAQSSRKKGYRLRNCATRG
jgi:hypothetical protein